MRLRALDTNDFFIHDVWKPTEASSLYFLSLEFSERLRAFTFNVPTFSDVIIDAVFLF